MVSNVSITNETGPGGLDLAAVAGNYLTMSKISLSESSSSAADGTVPDGRVRAVREFNRAYTNLLGLLRGGYLDTPYTLTEARVLFELGQRNPTVRSARCAGRWTSTPGT